MDDYVSNEETSEWAWARIRPGAFETLVNEREYERIHSTHTHTPIPQVQSADKY